jgi:hypothetical protein
VCRFVHTGPTNGVVTVGYDRPAMADQTPTQPLDQQLEEIGAQLAWVRDYL